MEVKGRCAEGEGPVRCGTGDSETPPFASGARPHVPGMQVAAAHPHNDMSNTVKRQRRLGIEYPQDKNQMWHPKKTAESVVLRDFNEQ